MPFKSDVVYNLSHKKKGERNKQEQEGLLSIWDVSLKTAERLKDCGCVQ